MEHVSSTTRAPEVGPGRFQTLIGGLGRRLSGAAPSVGELTPSFTVSDLQGGRATLESLLDPVKPLMLVFINPSCASCKEILGEIGGWQRAYADRLALMVISTGDIPTNQALADAYGLPQVLLQRDREVVSRYRLRVAPAAVLVQPNGRLASEARYGSDGIRHLVADTVGLVVAPNLANKAVHRGDLAPPIDGVDLQGSPIRLDDYLGAPLLVLFWSPDCEYCRQLLPQLRSFEAATTRTKLLVVSHGSVDTHQQLGLASPIMLDNLGSIARVYGTATTPAAVLIGARGTVASEVALGKQAVAAYIDRCHVPVITPATP